MLMKPNTIDTIKNKIRSIILMNMVII